MSAHFPGTSGRSIHVIGDLHLGRVVQERLAVVTRDLASGYEHNLPSARVQVGDLSQAQQTAQLALGVDFLDGLPESSGDLPLGRSWVAIQGNHDVVDQEFDVPVEDSDTYGYDGTGDWPTATGLDAETLAVDLGWVRLLLTGWVASLARLTDDQMTFIDDQATGTSQECWWVAHPPIFDTVTGPLTGKRRVYSSSGIEGFHVNGPDPDAESAAIKDLIAGHDNLRVYISGHTHSPIDAPGCVTSLTLGGKQVAHVNASAVQWTHPAMNRRREPIRTCYLDRTDDALEVRWRDHRLAAMVGPPGKRVEVVAL